MAITYKKISHYLKLYVFFKMTQKIEFKFFWINVFYLTYHNNITNKNNEY